MTDHEKGLRDTVDELLKKLAAVEKERETLDRGMQFGHAEAAIRADAAEAALKRIRESKDKINRVLTEWFNVNLHLGLSLADRILATILEVTHE